MTGLIKKKNQTPLLPYRDSKEEIKVGKKGELGAKEAIARV